MRALQLAIWATFVALTFRTTAVCSQSPDLVALQSEILELRSLSDFFTCDCSDSSYPAVATSSWCHCSNPYILPRQFAPEPSASYGQEWSNYSRSFTCLGSESDSTTTTTTGAEEQADPQCDFVQTFQPLERPVSTSGGVEGDQGQEELGDAAQQFFVSRSIDVGAAPTGPYWTQANANGTLSNLQKNVPSGGADGAQDPVTLTTSTAASKVFVNTWWFQRRHSAPSDSHVAVLEARTLVHDADTGAATVRLSLSTGRLSSRQNQSSEGISGLRVTDTVELPGLLLGSDSSFALTDQLTFIDVRNMSTSQSDDDDDEAALMPDRVFVVPVGFQSDWNSSSSRTEYSSVNTSGLLLLRVLWDEGVAAASDNSSNSDESGFTDELLATFDTDILLWVSTVHCEILFSMVYFLSHFAFCATKERNESSPMPALCSVSVTRVSVSTHHVTFAFLSH